MMKIKIVNNPALGKFVTAEDLIEVEGGKKIIVGITIWDKFPQSFTVDFSENKMRPRPATLLVQLKFTEKQYREKVGLPEWKLACKTNKFDRKGFKIWKVFDNPNRRVNKYLGEYNLTLDAVKKIASEMYLEAFKNL